jgi:hypothetical protein
MVHRLHQAEAGRMVAAYKILVSVSRRSDIGESSISLTRTPIIPELVIVVGCLTRKIWRLNFLLRWAPMVLLKDFDYYPEED